MEMKGEEIARETIKPSSLSHPHPPKYKLCSMDQFNPPAYLPVVLVYAAAEKACGGETDRSRPLKESLPQVLTRFYPLAGRLQDHLFVNCNDEGVHYLEVRFNFPLSNFLERPSMEAMKHFTPIKTAVTQTHDPLLLVQVSFFSCGGMVLGVKICHKVADPITLSTFINSWAATCVGSPNLLVPDLSVATRFPPIDRIPCSAIAYEQVPEIDDSIARRLVFTNPKISALKAKIESMGVKDPTRVEAVSGLLWCSAAKASRLSRSGAPPRRSALVGGVNMRGSLTPPLPMSSFGNVLGLLGVEVEDEREVELKGSVLRIRKGISECRRQTGAAMAVGEMLGLKPEQLKMYRFSSWCRMPFYEANFGWGKPTWACFGGTIVNNIALIDAKEGGGMEVWVRLPPEEMEFFDQDEDLLEFALVNPRINAT